MTEYRRELVQAIGEKLDSYPLLENLRTRHNLTLFNVLSPAVIVTIDREIGANPSVLSDSLCFLELTRHLSALYTNGDGHYNFMDVCVKTAATSRYPFSNDLSRHTSHTTLHEDIMTEYFVENSVDIEKLFTYNPVFLGIYIYTLISNIVK